MHRIIVLFIFGSFVFVPLSSIAQDGNETRKNRLDLLNNAERILFLGNSITYAGDYVVALEAWMEILETEGKLNDAPVVINMGLPSETVSGLSEEGHAGGRFPRPYLHDRLQNVLKVAEADLVFACYGINCGIYRQFDEDRFDAYRNGIRKLKQVVESTGATLILITPPTFDDKRSNKDFSYDSVLDRYSDWLTGQQEEGWIVVDLHSRMKKELHQRRQNNADFTFQPDAVHPNTDGHWMIASVLMEWFGDKDSANSGSLNDMFEHSRRSKSILDKIRLRMSVRCDAYLSAAGHKRPGMKEGLSIEEAERYADGYTTEIDRQLDR